MFDSPHLTLARVSRAAINASVLSPEKAEVPGKDDTII